jgi:Ni,Fe-hydrogenase maturation factor
LKALIGVGNEFGRDDGIGPALVAHVAESAPPGVSLSVVDGEPSQLLDAWDGVQLAVVFAVEAADLGFGTGLSQPDAEALPDLTRQVLDELG